MAKIDDTYKLIIDSLQQLNSSNDSYRNQLTKQIQSIQEQVDKKHIPVILEQDILKAIQSSIQKSITRYPCDTSTGYFSCINQKSKLPNACNCDSSLGK